MLFGPYLGIGPGAFRLMASGGVSDALKLQPSCSRIWGT